MSGKGEILHMELCWQKYFLYGSQLGSTISIEKMVQYGEEILYYSMLNLNILLNIPNSPCKFSKISADMKLPSNISQ